MDKSMMLGALVGVGIATAGAVIAGRALMSGPEQAEVIRVEPNIEIVSVPRQVCEDVAATRTVPRDDNLNNGTVIGAVVGGVLGNQVGDGRGRDAATVAGAVVGGLAGREIDRRHQKTDTIATTEQRCRTVTDSVERQDGFRVTYRAEGERRTVIMGHDPGEEVLLDEVDALPSAS